MGIPGVGSGILHPVMKNRFRVAFQDEAGVKLPYSDSLAMQVVRLSSFAQSAGCSILVTLEDDVTNYAAKAVQELSRIPSGNFKLVIEYLDGNEGVIRTATFDLCRLELVEHGDLDYAGSRSRDERLRLHIPLREGSLIEALNESPAARAVLTVLNGASFTVAGEADTATVQTLLSISYESVELTFPER